jgi:hypothetical protein
MGRVEEVDDAHQQLVEAPAVEPGDGAVERADPHRDRRRREPHGERGAPADEDARQQAAAEGIGAEPVRRRGRLVPERRRRGEGILAEEARRADRREERRTGEGAGIAAQARKRLGEGAGAAAHRVSRTRGSSQA